MAAQIEPLLDGMLRVFALHAADATTSLSAVAEVGGIVVASAKEAEERRIEWGDGEFEPFFQGDRVGLYLAPEVVAFLAVTEASIDTHIDFELRDELPNWWEQP